MKAYGINRYGLSSGARSAPHINVTCFNEFRKFILIFMIIIRYKFASRYEA